MQDISDKKIALFRVDASIVIGSGHIMRCITLAEFLFINGWKCFFACNKETLGFLNKKFHTIFELKVVESGQHQVSEIKKFFNFKPDLMIIDNYNWDHKLEKYFVNFAKKIIVIDDLANRKHLCDVLVDQTYNRTKKEYYKLVGSKTKILNGTKYAILRKEFIDLREDAEKKKIGNVEKILISIGSIDNENLILKILKSLNYIKCKAEIDIAINKLTPNLNLIKNYIKNSKLKISLNLNTVKMANLMLKADLAIGASGTTTWERCCMGLPTVQFIRADNQKEIAYNLHRDNVAINLGHSKKIKMHELNEALKFIINNKKIRNNLYKKSLKICDGFGLKRLYEEFIK